MIYRKGARHEYLTTFDMCYGKFRYIAMPFGLCNCPSVFARFFNKIFLDILDSYVMVYLYDILIFSETPTAHTEHVRKVLKSLCKHKLYTKM